MKQKLIFGTVLLTAVAVIIGVVLLSTPKRSVPPNAIGVFYASSTYAPGQIPLLFTNTTGKTLIVMSVALETKVANQWIREKRLEQNPQPGMILPHSYSFLAVEQS